MTMFLCTRYLLPEAGFIPKRASALYLGTPDVQDTVNFPRRNLYTPSSAAPMTKRQCHQIFSIKKLEQESAYYTGQKWVLSIRFLLCCCRRKSSLNNTTERNIRTIYTILDFLVFHKNCETYRNITERHM